MATVVLVHGIAQEQYSADTLEARWLPALAGGVRNAGVPDLADRLWRDACQGSVVARMAFYGNVFLTPGAQGAGDVDDLDPASANLAEELALVWLEAAADVGRERDRAEARRILLGIRMGDAGAQGPRAAIRPAMNGLGRLLWFAEGTRLAPRSVAQVVRYFSDEGIRERAQQAVLAHIGPDTRLVVAHSLGSVVAYEALHRTEQPVALLTLGSPLGLKSAVYERLRPQPPFVPTAVTCWDNLADRDDIVAARIDIGPFFPPAPGRSVDPTTHPCVDNGSRPHDVTHYLTKSVVGRVVADALS